MNSFLGFLPTTFIPLITFILHFPCNHFHHLLLLITVSDHWTLRFFTSKKRSSTPFFTTLSFILGKIPFGLRTFFSLQLYSSLLFLFSLYLFTFFQNNVMITQLAVGQYYSRVKRERNVKLDNWWVVVSNVARISNKTRQTLIFFYFLSTLDI